MSSSLKSLKILLFDDLHFECFLPSHPSPLDLELAEKSGTSSLYETVMAANGWSFR